MKKIVSHPIISVIIPCRNEEKYIGDCLISLLNQENLQHRLEIFVVDGMSTDNSRAIVQEISKNNAQVILLENPRQTTPHALNIGIQKSRSEFIAILGAHAEYASDYLTNCLGLINQHPEVSCVGGPINSLGKSSFGKAAALAMSNPIGVGNAKHRFPDYEGYSEMACFPVFRSEVFNKYGLYDESLIRNQDDEFCFRITKGGGKVFISPKAKSGYYVRETPISLFEQYFQYGFWRVAVLKKHGVPISYRQQVPIIFYLLVLIATVIGIAQNEIMIIGILPTIYLILIFAFTVPIILNQKLSVAVCFPLAVIILHISYAVGFFVGTVKFLLLKNNLSNSK